MKENPNISTMDLVNMLNISQTAVENQLKKLRERNIIKRIGPDKGGYWVVFQNKPSDFTNIDTTE